MHGIIIAEIATIADSARIAGIAVRDRARSEENRGLTPIPPIHVYC
jgi:hypothetical protein